MESFFISTLVVGLSEIGDRTQLLALLLAARYRKPLPILLGILLATILNHALAGILGKFLGQWIDTALSPQILRCMLGFSFLLMGIWVLNPDKIEGEQDAVKGKNAFVTTLIAFFIAEMGDKTEFATAALAIKYPHLVPVICGTTLGMMLANIPAVLLGHIGCCNLPLSYFRYIASGLLVVQALLTFAGIATMPGI